MGYDRGDSFPFDFEPNGNTFGSKSKGKLSPRSYPIRCEGKWKYSFLSVYVDGLGRLYQLLSNALSQYWHASYPIGDFHHQLELPLKGRFYVSIVRAIRCHYITWKPENL